MRTARSPLLTVLAAALALLMTVALSSTGRADAAGGHHRTAVHAKIVNQEGTLMLVGTVRPRPHGKVVVQRADRCDYQAGTCDFTTYRKVRTDGHGRFKVQVQAPKKGTWYWQARVGSHKSNIWSTCTTTTDRCPR